MYNVYYFHEPTEQQVNNLIQQTVPPQKIYSSIETKIDNVISADFVPIGYPFFIPFEGAIYPETFMEKMLKRYSPKTVIGSKGVNVGKPPFWVSVSSPNEWYSFMVPSEGTNVDVILGECLCPPDLLDCIENDPFITAKNLEKRNITRKVFRLPVPENDFKISGIQLLKMAPFVGLQNPVKIKASQTFTYPFVVGIILVLFTSLFLVF